MPRYDICLSDFTGITLFVIPPHTASSSVSVVWCILCLYARVSFENIFLLFFRFCSIAHCVISLVKFAVTTWTEIYFHFFFSPDILWQQLLAVRIIPLPLSNARVCAPNSIVDWVANALFPIDHIRPVSRNQSEVTDDFKSKKKKIILITESTNKRIGKMEMSNSATTEWMLSQSYRIYKLRFFFCCLCFSPNVYRYQMRRAPLSAFRSMSVGSSFLLLLLSLSPNISASIGFLGIPTAILRAHIVHCEECDSKNNNTNNNNHVTYTYNP